MFTPRIFAAFSALQRAENSSIMNVSVASPTSASFSALQRAENSSMLNLEDFLPSAWTFQCSSASRKFLNDAAQRDVALYRQPFSALQRAENSSIGIWVADALVDFGFQCSSASRKFLNHHHRPNTRSSTILSVLFSEPKIPQFDAKYRYLAQIAPFSALQRAENSSIERAPQRNPRSVPFSALQRAENSSIHKLHRSLRVPTRLSVLFSEPKIPQSTLIAAGCPTIPRFQCSSASRKFLNLKFHRLSPQNNFQCSSASRKFLNLSSR